MGHFTRGIAFGPRDETSPCAGYGNGPTVGSWHPGTEVVQKSGTSKLILGAANLYAGNTTVQAGTLALGAAASIAESAAISVSTGATLDVSALTSGLTIAAGQSLGGAGSILGGLTFGSGSNLDFSSTLTVNSGTVTFNGFGMADIVGLDGTVVSAGTYTLLSGNATFDLTNALNVGAANARDSGGGKLAYLQQGSLQVVVPEPGALILASVGLAGLAIWSRRRA